MHRFRRLRLPALILGPPLLALLVYSTCIEPCSLDVTHQDILIEGLPKEFEGFRIVQLSDIHLGVWIRLKDIRRFVAVSNAQRPDAVVITGDFATRLSDDFEGLGAALAGLKAKHGTYAVLGNHDYWEDEEAITRALRANDIDVLFDECRDIRIGSQRLRIVGTDDSWAGSPDYDQAFADIVEGDSCIAIAHNPDAVLSIDGRLADLVLVGHTHGGLINLPGIGAPVGNSSLGRRIVSGMHEINGVRVYINRGLGRGSTLLPMRFRCRPEVAVFTLRRAGKEQ